MLFRDLELYKWLHKMIHRILKLNKRLDKWRWTNIAQTESWRGRHYNLLSLSTCYWLSLDYPAFWDRGNCCCEFSSWCRGFRRRSLKIKNVPIKKLVWNSSFKEYVHLNHSTRYNQVFTASQLKMFGFWCILLLKCQWKRDVSWVEDDIVTRDR